MVDRLSVCTQVSDESLARSTAGRSGVWTLEYNAWPCIEVHGRGLRWFISFHTHITSVVSTSAFIYTPSANGTQVLWQNVGPLCKVKNISRHPERKITLPTVVQIPALISIHRNSQKKLFLTVPCKLSLIITISPCLPSSPSRDTGKSATSLFFFRDIKSVCPVVSEDAYFETNDHGPSDHVVTE